MRIAGRLLALTVTLATALAVVLSPVVADARKVTGTKRADKLGGTKRADVLKGGWGNDRLKGGRGRDRLLGGKGRDRLLGGKGNDRLGGGPGNDVLKGGPGRDVLNCGPGRDRAAADSSDVVRSNCETVTGRDNGGGGGGGGGGDTRPPQSIAGQFDGVLTTTVRYLSVCTGQVIGEQTTQIPSRVTLGPALRPNPADLPADTPERNPLNLILGQTNVAGTIAPGSINIASAARFRFSPIRSLTLQYWNLALNGNQVTGTLVQDWRESGAAFNLLAAHQELLACNPNFGTYVNQLDIAEGATLTGTITAQQVRLSVSGRSFAGFHQFSAQITANRSG